MSTSQNRPDRISELLAAYGSDLSRWPEEGRQAISALSFEAQAEILREDLAFDQLIMKATKSTDTAPAPDALMARILAAAASEIATPVTQSDLSKVVDLRTAAPRNDIGTDRAQSQKRDWRAAAALLAASLVLGIFVGSTERGQSTAISIGNFAGLSVAGSAVQMTALDEALQVQDDEDIL